MGEVNKLDQNECSEIIGFGHDSLVFAGHAAPKYYAHIEADIINGYGVVKHGVLLDFIYDSEEDFCYQFHYFNEDKPIYLEYPIKLKENLKQIEKQIFDHLNYKS